MDRSSATKVGFIEPMYALSVKALPETDDRLYEIKLDGYRCIAARDSAGSRLWSRRGNSFTGQFPAIANDCKELPANTVVDGEIVAFDSDGKASFNLLQHHRDRAAVLRYYLFDVLIHCGRKLIDVPLSERRRYLDQLRSAVKRSSTLAISETVDAPLPDMIKACKELGVEGVVAKRKDSFYESGGRSGAWLKYKFHQGQEFVVGGYTPGNPFDALVVGYYERRKLLFAGKVRNGFVPHVRREVMALMKPLVRVKCPFANLPEKRRTPWALDAEGMKNCVWLKPDLVAQFEYREWTPDGHLRHASFAGMREDKTAREVVREG